jgi:hypothetical protein
MPVGDDDARAGAGAVPPETPWRARASTRLAQGLVALRLDSTAWTKGDIGIAASRQRLGAPLWRRALCSRANWGESHAVARVRGHGHVRLGLEPTGHVLFLRYRGAEAGRPRARSDLEIL